MLNAENEQDKERFEKLKEAEVERGRDDEKAIDVAAAKLKNCGNVKLARKRTI